jgi:Holliday junction resolvasome RuvABC endonuclease subunit
MQRHHQRDQLKHRIEELIKLGFSSDVSSDPQLLDGLSKRLLRLVRHTSSIVHEHAAAIRQKLRESIISQATGGSSGPTNLAIFERECDNINKVNPHLLNSYLAMLEQLKTSAVSTNYIQSDYSSPRQSATADATAATAAARDTVGIREHAAKRPAVAGGGVSSLENRDNFVGPSVLRFESVLADEEANALSIELSHVWVPKDVESKLIRDLLYTFQVSVPQCTFLSLM